MDPKTRFRRSLRERRRLLDEAERRAAARALVGRLCRHPLLRRARHLALYYPHDGEIDPTGLVEEAWRQGKRVYLPVLWPLGGRRLRFAPLAPDSRWVRNRYGIPEPLAPARALRPAARLDLIVLPLVAADPRGHRLGMGGGYYDRSLAFLRRRRGWHRPRLLGAAYHFQLVRALPADPWDVQLDGLVTDQAVIACR